MIENLTYIKNKGIEKFVRKERRRWKCAECGNTVSVHRGYCLKCRTERFGD